MSFEAASLSTTRDLLSVARDRACRATALWLFVLMTCVYFLTASGRIDIVDGAIRFDVTHNLLELGRPVLTHWLPVVQGPDLQFYGYYEFGTSVLALPFVMLARWLAPGSINAEQFAFTLTTIPFAALTVALLFLAFVRLGRSPSSARNWALLGGFGSMLWPYAGSTFDLAPQAFFLTLGVLAGADALLFNSRPLAILSGMGFFWLATIQETYLLLAGPVIFAVHRLGRKEVLQNLRRAPLVWIAAGIVGGFVSVLLYNFYRFADPFYTGREMVHHPFIGNPLAGFAGLFLSPAKSVFLYSPLHALGLLGLFRLSRNQPGWALPALGTLLCQVLLVSSLAFWAGEWAWGPRYLLATTPLVLLGAPFAFSTSRQLVTGMVACAAVLVQLLGISIDTQLYYLNRGFRPHFWLDNRFMYDDSPLLRRPQEIWKTLQFDGYRPGMKLVPGPFDEVVQHPPPPDELAWAQAYRALKRPEPVVTTGMSRPPRALREARPNWMDDYYILNVPRPWILWAAGLPPELRPVPLLPWLALGLLGLVLSTWQLLFRASPRRVAVISSGMRAETRTSG